MRGVMGAGKSTFIAENNLKQYTLSADEIRLMHQSPIMSDTGELAISGKNDSRVWKTLMNVLEDRMSRGELTVVDATHAKMEAINKYRKLVKQYRYRVIVVDFSDVPLDVLLERNNTREQYKKVPEMAILNSYERMQTEKVSGWVKVVKPHELKNEISYRMENLNQWKKIHHIGDVHGCYTALQEYLKDGLKEDELYIFVGDYLDRGIENYQTLIYLVSIMEKPNVIFIEGNHEHHINNWAHDLPINSKQFKEHTQKEIEEAFYYNVPKIVEEKNTLKRMLNKILGKKPEVYFETVLDNESLGKYKSEVRQFYRKLRQLLCYEYNGKTVLVTHGGLAKLPDELFDIATTEFIKGVGDYNLDIDDVWDKNETYIDGNGKKIINAYQIHGHRNIYRLPTKATDSSFNLEGQVEMGKNLRVVTLDDNGFEFIEVKNNVFNESIIKKSLMHNIQDISVEELLELLEGSDYIKAKNVCDNIYSYNFTKEAFNKKVWDELIVKARGLFINKETKKIVSRSYDKFFNIQEREETKINALAEGLVFPVKVYSKPNGYLGIIGYDEESDSLIVSSKSDAQKAHADYFNHIIVRKMSPETLAYLKEYIKLNNVSVTFEVIAPVFDPHIIEYKEDDLILLDIVDRTVQFNKKPYEDVKNLAKALQVKHKEHIVTHNDWVSFYNWYKSVLDDNTIEDEGFVIEDSKGFMTKLKLPYYNFWKQMRMYKDMICAKNDYKILGSKLYTPMHNRVLSWMRSKDVNYLKDNSIITIRNDFYKEN